MTASSEARETKGRGLVKRVAIPDVAGLHERDARIVLKHAGFENVRTHYVEDYSAEFSVVEQLPRSGLLAPREGEVTLYVARVNLVNYLPQIFQKTEMEGGSSFLRRFLNVVQHIHDSTTSRLQNLHHLFDPRTTDAEFLPWLASWVAITLNPEWGELQRRKMLLAATQLFPIRGTATAICEFVRIYAEAHVEIEENVWPFQGFKIGVHSTVGEDTVILPPMNLAHCFVVKLDKPVSATTEDEIIKIHQIIQSQKPAHTSYFLSFSDEIESGSMGTFMAIGVTAEELMVEDSAPLIGMGIGIGSDGAVYEGEGVTGLLVSEEVTPAVADAEASEAQKKQPMLRVNTDKAEDDGGKSS